jgi:hypothetical protein
MPSKQDIAIAKGLAKEAGKMVAEELAKMLIPGIGWFTGMVSVLKVIKAMNDPGDESRPIELTFRVAQDARFFIDQFDGENAFVVWDFFNAKQEKLGGVGNADASKDPFRLQIGSPTSWNKTTPISRVTDGKKPAKFLFFGGFYKNNQNTDGSIVSLGSERLSEKLLNAWPALQVYSEQIKTGAAISVAACKVSLYASRLFDTDAKPNFSETNPQPLLDYMEVLTEYCNLVSELGTFPANDEAMAYNFARSREERERLTMIGKDTNTINRGLFFKTNNPQIGPSAKLVTDQLGFETTPRGVNKNKFPKRGTVASKLEAAKNGQLATVPGTQQQVDMSMPGSPLDKPAATPPPATLPEAVYTIDRPDQRFLAGPSVVAIREDGSVVTSRDLRPIQNTLAPSKAEQQLGKLGLVENVSTASKPGTEPAGATDRSVLVLFAAAAAALALL